MATRAKTASKDAIDLLTADHDNVKKLFKKFERLHKAQSHEEAEEVAREICIELTIHATVEEEIFYPEVRASIDNDDLMDEAEVEHSTAKDLIAQIEEMNADSDKFAAKVMVLGEYINHHVEEEQGEMFPKARKAKLDLVELGQRMAARKDDLKDELAVQA